MRKVTAEAGPSSANLGHGFDVLAVGLDSLDLPRDRVTVEYAQEWSVAVEGPEAKGVTGPNCALLAAKALSRRPLKLTVWKGLPPGSGIGSSAASAAAAAKAVAALLELPEDRLVDAAAEGERASAGVAHKDNVAASLLGGLVCVAGKPFSWPVPGHVRFAVVIPKVRLTTREMRRVVPKSWPRDVHTAEVARAIATAQCLSRGEIERLGEVIRGSIVEERRSKLIPRYREVVAAAEKAGAPAVTISGSGPSMIAIVDSRKTDPRKVAGRMRAVFRWKARVAVAEPGKPAKVTG